MNTALRHSAVLVVILFAACGSPAPNGVITFDWEGWSVAGPWGATGTLNGDSLTSQYNQIMELSDFEDAVYVLKR